MTKRFYNIADDGVEKALRRGFTVPKGAVNVAWVKAPALNPTNNIVIIDTSKVVAENANTSIKRKQLAFSNALGVLEDVHGNEIWDDEYPVISDIFSASDADFANGVLDDDTVLSFLHVSRYFHIDFAGLANASLVRYDSPDIKVVDKNGVDHVDENGRKRYRIYMVQPTGIVTPLNSSSSAYRVYAFLDMDPDAEELYLTYNKVELNPAGGFKLQELNYRELVNPRPYFKYMPEESDVIDLAQSNQKIFSSKPIGMKEQILGLPQPNSQGWRYFVPRKAIPDPRVFQLFRWRAACEFTQAINQDNAAVLAAPTQAIIRAGVIVPPGGNHNSTRANYFFYQLNESDYNFSKIRFVNPMKSTNYTWTRAEQQQASYWHVDISTVSLDDLSKFDVLIWAPTATNVNVTPYLQKISYFTENVGGTFIFETSGNTTFTNLPDVTFSPNLGASPITPTANTYAYASTLKFHDSTPDVVDDTFSSFGMWKEWPPNVSNIINDFKDIGTILSSADVLAGWSLDDAELEEVSGYENVTGFKLQFLSYASAEYAPVLEAGLSTNPSASVVTTMINKRFTSGGNIFVSTANIFEDHLINVNGQVASRSMQVPSFLSLPDSQQRTFVEMVSSQPMAAEMKLRINVMLFATVNKPSPVKLTSSELSNNGTTQSTTVYSNWESSWVINPNNGVLSDEEKREDNFTLLPTGASDIDPVWQRVLSDRKIGQLIQSKIKELDPDNTNPIYNTLESAGKRYFIVVTNPLVQVLGTELLSADSIPTAWTTAYSPKFEVPTHLGSYVVRDEMISGTGVGEGKRVYPPKPYDLLASASYMNSGTTKSKIKANLHMTGTLKRMITIPPSQEVRRTWVPPTSDTVVGGSPDRLVDVVLHWNTDGSNSTLPGYLHQHPSFNRENGIDTWTAANYANITPVVWPTPGETARFGRNIAVTRQYAPVVVEIQQTLNQLIFFGHIAGPYLTESGIYDIATEQAVLKFQQSRGAKYQDGIVDAETWALFGYWYLLLHDVPDYMTNVPFMVNRINKAWTTMRLRSISDDNAQSYAAFQSMVFDGPPQVSETFRLEFNQALPVYQVSILPYCESNATNNIVLDWLDLNPTITSLAGYNFNVNASPGAIYGKNGPDGQWLDVIMPSLSTRSVIFRITQNGPSGFGSSRFLGIRDVAVYAKRFVAGTPGTTVPGNPGYYRDDLVTVPGRTYQDSRSFTYNAMIEFEAGIQKTITPTTALATADAIADGITQAELIGSAVTEAKFDTNSLVITPADQSNSFIYTWDNQVTSNTTYNITTDLYNVPTNALKITYNGYQNTLSAENFVPGPRIGNGSFNYYTRTKAGVVDPYVRSRGWVTKEDGLKLICDVAGKPTGFPAALPNQVTTSTHFARYRLNSFDTDQTLYYGFYDIQADEFVVNAYGEPEISYYDYIRRGPTNIFISVMTTYELDVNTHIPGTTDAVMRPFKWAMPVYGVTSGLKSKVQIEPLSPDLGVSDVWAIPIKTGAFARRMTLRFRSEGSFTSYLKNYQGTNITAYYDVPEARGSAWSTLYGRPFVDVTGETPLIIDDDTIKIRQYPILMVQRPTAAPSPADPWMPVMRVYRRETLTGPWSEVPFAQIKDYKAWDGTIILKQPLANNDPRLVKVDYTSERKVYNFKHDGTNRVNLNPYLNSKPEWTNKPLYIYMVPEYIVDRNNAIISGSVRSKTILLSETSAIFNPSQVEFDPTAMLLGIVYISSAMDVNDLVMLDTRRRGGGISTDYNDNEVFSIERESESYWDVAPLRAASYQKGGYVIIRLPATMKDDFTEKQIRKIVEENITAGVAYDLEDLQGNRW